MTAQSATENESIARRYPEEVANEKNPDVLDELLTEDFVEHGPFGEIHGQEEAKADMEWIMGAFPDLTATVEDAVSQGDVVAMRVTLRGTHEGEFMGYEPTGKSFEVSNMVFTRIEGEKIAERWLQPDVFGMLVQIGAMEPPKVPDR